MAEQIDQTLTTRIRFKFGQLEFELEGPKAFDEFHRLRDEGFGKLALDGRLPVIPPITSMAAAQPGPERLHATPANGRPTLPDLAVKNVAQSEREWVTVYAHYLSELDGKKTFSRGDIWGKYKESGRDNESRQANLSENINRAVKAGWLTRIKENTYAIQGDGQAKALEIMSRTASPKEG